MKVYGAATPALKSLDREGRVLYLGSISKTLDPGLRLGFLVAPPALIREALRRLMLRHPPGNNQRAVALFLSLGHHDALIQRMIHAYRSRWECMGDALPVVAVTPETGSGGIGLGGFQETDQLPIFSRITKYQGHVMRPDRMAELTGRCFNRAINDRGPTQLNIPRDHFYGEIDVEIPGPKRIEHGAGGETSLSRAADLLAWAEFPVIVSGGGVIMTGDGGVAAAVALAERLGAPVVNSYLHNDSFPASHELWAGPLGYQGSKAGPRRGRGAARAPGGPRARRQRQSRGTA